jgi:hypothetical protein
VSQPYLKIPTGFLKDLFALAMRVDKRTQFSLHEEGFIFCAGEAEEYDNAQTPAEN